MLFLNYPSGWKCQQLQGGIGPGRKAVCVFMSALPRAKGSRIHKSTARCLSPATAIADIGKRLMMKWHRGWVRNPPLFFPLAAQGTHFTSTMRTTLLEMIFRQKREKKKERKECPPSCEFLSRLPSWNQGSFSSEFNEKLGCDWQVNALANKGPPHWGVRSENSIGLCQWPSPCPARWILQVTKFIFAITNWLQLL